MEYTYSSNEVSQPKSTSTDALPQICKAFAVVLLVLAHAGGPAWLHRFVFQFPIPVLFLCAGYFFRAQSLSNEKGYVVSRFARIYLPFFVWSLFFLVVHNLWFPVCGLSETYGAADGTVLHPYSLREFSQRVFDVAFLMKGYDEFMCNVFWVFRAMFFASLGWLVAYKLMRRTHPRSAAASLGWGVAAIALVLMVWQVLSRVSLLGSAEGDARDLLALILLALGFVYRRYAEQVPLTWITSLGAFAVLVLGAIFLPYSMENTLPLGGCFVQLLTGVAGFALLLWLAQRVNAMGGVVKTACVFVGRHALYIFAFHLLAFKVAGMIKVASLGLPFERVADFPVVHADEGGFFFALLYWLVGVALPLLWHVGYQALQRQFEFSLSPERVLNMEFFKKAGAILWFLACSLAIGIFKLLRAFVFGVWRSLKNFVQGIKDILTASNPNEE